MGFPGGSDGKQSVCNTGDLGSIPGLGRSPGGGHGNPLQCSCLENPHGQWRLAGYSPWGCQNFVTLWTIGLQDPLSMGVLQARTLEWVAMPSSRGSSQPRDRTCISYTPCTRRWILYHGVTWEALSDVISWLN